MLKTVTNNEGKYFITDLPIGDYVLIISKNGCITMNEYITIEATDSIIYNLALEMISSAYTGKGTASGTIRDAQTGNGVGGDFSIYIRKGINNTRYGDIVNTISTNQSGQYNISLDAGNYTLQIVDNRQGVDSNVPRYQQGIINVKVLAKKILPIKMEQ